MKSTWLKAIKNNQFLTWPGLTTDLVNKHLPMSTATAQGHLHRERQKLQSTKLLSVPASQGTSKNTDSTSVLSSDQDHHLEDTFPSTREAQPRCHQSMYILMQGKDLTPAYQDLTGRFPVKSSRGNEYILVGYYPDGNYIHGIPVKNRSATVLTEAWKDLHAIFSKQVQHQLCGYWTTNVLTSLNRHSSRNKLTFNWYHPTPTEGTKQKGQSRHIRTILRLALPPWTPNIL